MSVSEDYRDFVSTYGDSLSRYFSRIQLLLMEELTGELNRKHGISLGQSQFHCLQSLCLQGMQQNELAKRLGISKQALGQLIKDLEAQRLIKRFVDPNDARARIIKHTKKGERVVATLIELSMNVEMKLSEIIGKKKYLMLKDSLSLIESTLKEGL